jgi:pimeloyl-ACP methyl ester carboxylesterase/DNA-binding CsgD family transcriptional regulator
VATVKAPSAAAHEAPPVQEIRFCRGTDGTRLAFAKHGSGPPLVVVSCWLGHLQYDWQSPVWRHFLEGLGGIATTYRYDERGFGLSDWSIEDFSLEARVDDLEAVITAAELDRFALLGMSGGGPVAITYAARHPERVTRLVLYGAVTAGHMPRTAEEQAEADAYKALIQVGWARPDNRFRRVFTSMFIPDATDEQMRWLDDLQRMATSTENAIASREGRMRADVRSLLPSVAGPTLGLYARGDNMTPFESAIETCSSIPGARLVPLDSANHILLADEPAWPVFLREVEAFMAPDAAIQAAGGAVAGVADLTNREREIVRLTATGLTNTAIAEQLTLSPRTVERHLSNAYLKLNISGKAARTAAAASVVRDDLQ